MAFDKDAHIAKMQPAIKKLLAQLAAKGVTFNPKDGEFENVVLTLNGKEVRISWHSFYRFSGIACVYKEKGEGEKKAFDIIEVTNDMFIQNFMKPIVELHLGLIK